MPLSRLLFAAAAGLMSLGAFPAAAQMGPPKLDQNGDGRVLFAEYRTANVDRTLETLDSDRNGQVSRKEFDKVAGMARTFGGARAVAAIWSQEPRSTVVMGSRASKASSTERNIGGTGFEVCVAGSAKT